MDSAIRADSKEAGAIWQGIAAQREAAFGIATEARKTAAVALKLAPASQGAQAEAALAFALAGDGAQAETLARDLAQRFPLDTQIQSLWLPAIQSQLALNRQRPRFGPKSPAKYFPRRSSLDWSRFPLTPPDPASIRPTIRGKAYLAAGQKHGPLPPNSRRFLITRVLSGIAGRVPCLSLVWRGQMRFAAKALHGADSDAARLRALAAYNDFLILWKDADPNIPIQQQARAEYSKLQ